MENITSEKLRNLGLECAAERVDKTKELKRKLVIAYEHFRVVTPKIIERFQAQLKKKTKKKDGYYVSFDKLRFTNLKDWPKIPPPVALLKLEEARKMNCFDSFAVADIETVTVYERPDPIIFGEINGSLDKFFICQWDNDVSIDDILEKNEG